MNYLLRLVIGILLCSGWSACTTESALLTDIVYGEIISEVNPYGRVPLSGLLKFSTKEPCRVTITVTGKNPLVQEFTNLERIHEIPVLGLYADTLNRVNIELQTKEGKIYQGETILQTAELPAVMPEIAVTTLNRDQMEPGMHLVELQAANNGKFLTYTIVFDDAGDIRWFMDMSERQQITYTPYRLKNGNWLYLNWQNLLEVDDLGGTMVERQMAGTAGNHEVIELPDGKLLMGGSMRDSYIIHEGQQVSTRSDHVILFDPATGRTANDWDMRKVMDVDRTYFPADFSLDPVADWYHVNSIAVAPNDDLLVSSRTQGVARIDKDNNLKWILAPHSGWGNAGLDGQSFATSDYLLTAVDANGNPYPENVQSGEVSADDFDWPVGQHSLNLLPNGHLLLFDNGLFRNRQKIPQYSRAVEYAIDEEKKTITQVWQYGKERGKEMASPITSDVDVLPTTNNRLITAGNIRTSEVDPPHAKLIEITYPDNRVVFEAQLRFKDAKGTKAQSWGQFDIVFRGERFSLIQPQQKQ